MTTYTLKAPVPAAVGKDSGRTMLPEITEVSLRRPSARSLVALEEAGAMRPGRETQLTVGLAKAVVFPQPNLVVEDLWFGDIQGITEAAKDAGFFPSEDGAGPDLAERLAAIEKRLQAIEKSLGLT